MEVVGRFVIVTLLASACGRMGFDERRNASGDGAVADACQFGPWTKPTLIAELSTDYEEYEPGISADGNTVAWSSDRPGTLGGLDLWMATRASAGSPFDPAVHLTAQSSAGSDESPSLSVDGLTLLFASTRTNPGSLYMSQRATTSDAFGPPTDVVGPFGQFTALGGPKLTHDGLTLYFDALGGGGPGGWDIWSTSRATLNDPWGMPVLVPGVNSPADDGNPFLDVDGLTIYFVTSRFEAQGDLAVATRPDLMSPFSTPTILQDVQFGPGVGEYGADMSDDGKTMILSIHWEPPLKSNLFISTRACQ
jgi:hypothetical protein